MFTTHLPGWPRWLRELDQSLATRPQMVLTGNIRDVCQVPTDDGFLELSNVDAIGSLLIERRVATVFNWDPTGRISVHPPAAYSEAQQRLPDLRMPTKAPTSVDQATFLNWIEGITSANDLPMAIVIDYASRIALNPSELDAALHSFFLKCLRLSHSARELRRPLPDAPPRFNPVIWIADRVQDLPAWFMVGNTRVQQITIPLPDRDTRQSAAKAILPHFPDGSKLSPHQTIEIAGRVADLTDGMTLRAIKDIKALSDRYGLGPSDVAETVRRYRAGIADNPWKQDYLSDRIAQASATLGKSIMGQEQAIDAAVSILTRAYMGMSGAQSATVGSRPRGVMFLAGPTGVGKTEMAKSITRLIFGDEQAYVRFDMSEFSSEHSEARLIGAPPGYVGFDAGGELVNAVRQRPFSVLLFDEIEKAHPRIIDKFLQILEDGRLTDGRGDTAYFSECLLVFTSNLGVYLETKEGRVLNVSPGDPFEKVRKRIRDAIDDHFRRRLGRPEIINRMGENIIIFDFIRPRIAGAIAEKMIAEILNRAHAVHGVEVALSPTARAALLQRATDDPSNGGRGIGNRLETLLINPLAMALFARDLPRGARVEITGLRTEGARNGVDLS